MLTELTLMISWIRRHVMRSQSRRACVSKFVPVSADGLDASDASQHPLPPSGTRAADEVRPPPTWAIEELIMGCHAEPLKAPLNARDAAEQFVAWLRATGAVGEFPVRTLTSLYLEHCEGERHTPVATNILLGELKKVEGVFKLQAKGISKAGKRHRPTRWVVGPRAQHSRPPG